MLFLRTIRVSFQRHNLVSAILFLVPKTKHILTVIILPVTKANMWELSLEMTLMSKLWIWKRYIISFFHTSAKRVFDRGYFYYFSPVSEPRHIKSRQKMISFWPRVLLEARNSFLPRFCRESRTYTISFCFDSAENRDHILLFFATVMPP